MKKTLIFLGALTAVCFVITVVDTITHHALNPVYACATAADLCIVGALTAHGKPAEQKGTDK